MGFLNFLWGEEEDEFVPGKNFFFGAFSIDFPIVILKPIYKFFSKYSRDEFSHL